jgi:endonuclease/exonuclease/phosphatase family metal-dependent hydrolase
MKKLLGFFLIISVTCLFSRLCLLKPQVESLEKTEYTMLDKPHLTVATYNICHGTDADGNLRLHEISSVLSDADIVFICEVDRVFNSRSNYLDELMVLKRLTGLKYHYFAQTLEKAKLFNFKGSYGIAILSRYPLKDPKIHYLPTEYFNEPRAAISFSIEWQNQEVKLLATHLSPSYQEKNIQLEYIANIAVDTDLLLGDFNAHPHEIDFLKKSLVLVSAEAKPTFPADNPTFQIDYILYGNKLKLRDSQTIPVLYSDHLPVRASFYLNE